MKNVFCTLVVNCAIELLIDSSSDLPLLRSTDIKILPWGALGAGADIWYENTVALIREVTANVPLNTVGFAP